MKPILLLAFCAATAGLLAGQTSQRDESASEPKIEITGQHYRVYRADGTPASLDDVLAASMASTVTFLGESHDDPVAHHLEERVLRETAEPGMALSLEMFESDVQYVLDEYLSGMIREDHLIKSGRAWKNYDSDYRPLIEFAKENDMPVVAANVPRRYVNMVSRLGPASLLELSDRAKEFLPPLPYAEASPRYAQRFAEIMEQHSDDDEDAGETQDAEDAGPDEAKGPAKSGENADQSPASDVTAAASNVATEPDSARGLQAQSLWDASMAYSIANFLTRHPNSRVLHINGSFHSAEHLGILDHLARYRPGTSMLVITMLPEKSFPAFEPETMRDQGDFIIVTDPSLPRSYGTQPAQPAGEAGEQGEADAKPEV